jgi:hypothetical protein
MVKIPTMLAKVKLQVEKSMLFKDVKTPVEKALSVATEGMGKSIIGNLKEQMKILDDIVEKSSDISEINYALTKKSGLQKELGQVVGGKAEDTSAPLFERGLKTISGALGGILGGITKIFGAVSIMAIIFEVAKPIFKILEAFFKMVREFVRPIADVITMLLSPILIMIKPIVYMFRLLMQPFRELAMKGMAAANVLIAQGMRMGGEEGKAMVGEGMMGALSSAGLMMSGFLQVVFTPLIKAFENVPLLSGVAEGFVNALKDWEEASIRGVTRTITLKDTFLGFIPILGDTREAASRALKAIDEQMSLLDKTVSSWSIDNAKNILEASNEAANLAIGTLGGALSTDPDSVEKHALLAEKAAQFFADRLGDGSTAESLVGRMVGAIVKTNELSTAFENLSKNMSVDIFSGYFNKIKENIESTKPDTPGMTDYAIGLGKTFLSFLSVGVWRPKGPVTPSGMQKQYSEDLQEWSMNSREQLMSFSENLPKDLRLNYSPLIGDVDNYVKEKTAMEEKGWFRSLGIVKYFLGESLIPDAILNGFKHILNITNEFIEQKSLIMKEGMDNFIQTIISSMNSLTEMLYIPDAIEDGFKHILNITDTYTKQNNLLLENSYNDLTKTLTTTTKDSFNEMQKSTDTFVKALQDMSNTIKNLARDTSNYASQAQASAARAASAARSASASRGGW